MPVDSQMKTFYISIECIVAFHVNMLQQLHLPVNSIICKQKKIPSNLFNLFNIANNNINSTSKLIDVWNWFLWCKREIQVLAQVFLKTPTLHAVTAEVIELNNRKNLKKTSFISSQRTIVKTETRAAKSEKVQTRVEIFFFNFLR